MKMHDLVKQRRGRLTRVGGGEAEVPQNFGFAGSFLADEVYDIVRQVDRITLSDHVWNEKRNAGGKLGRQAA